MIKQSRFLFLGLLLLVTQAIFAQIKTITGKVIDEQGNPMPGVSVLIKGTNKGVATDFDGLYTIDAKKGDVLVYSFIGFNTKNLTVKAGDSKINVTLKEATQVLDDVVVTALGIKRAEKALSYDVQQVSSEELTKVKDANFVNSLNGKVAGIQINKSSSGVGGATKVVMRGAKSIEGNNNVLYVVDGVPLFNTADRSNTSSGFGGSSSGEGISSFNPEDIESVNVLSGPAAAALYGSAAANGVIIINTKRGVEGKTSVKISSSVEVLTPFILPEFQNTYGRTIGSYTSWGDKLEKPSDYTPSDFFQQGYTFNNSVSLSTGNKINQTYISGATVNSEGIVPNNKYHKYNASIRNTTKLLDDHLTIDISANYVREYFNNMVSFGTYFNPIVGAYLYPVGENFEKEKAFERYDEELGYYTKYWSVGDLGMNIDNPYWVAYRNIRPEVKDRYMFYAQAKYDINPDMNLSGRVRLDNEYSEREDKRYASTAKTFAGEKGRYSYSNGFVKQKYADLILNYSKSFMEDFHTTINIGSSIEDLDSKGRGYGGDLLLVPNKFTYTNIDPGKGSPSESGGNSRVRNIAVFSSAEISWKSALYLTLTGRADKNSKLVNTNSEWVFYPSIGLSTVITELLPFKFKSDIKDILSYMKIRASYTDIALPLDVTGLTKGTVTRKIEGGTVKSFKFYPLSDFTRQATRSWEVGLDAKMFNNMVSLGLTFYKSNTLDQVIKAKLSGTSGYDFMYYQSGNIENRGLELTLGYNQRIGDNFKYNTSVTATANRNKIIRLGGDIMNPFTGEKIKTDEIIKGRFILREGGSYGDVYDNQRIARDVDGYFKYNPGGGLLTEKTEPFKLGSINPDWNLGWSNSFSYKGLNLYLLFNARIGGIVTSKTQATLDLYGVSKRSAEAREAGGVQLGNIKVAPEVFYQTVNNLDAYNTYSATNVRLQQVSLGYTFSDLFGGEIKDLSVSVVGNNLLMIYNKAPYDPELTASTGYLAQGYDYFMLPSLRNIGFSVKFKL